MKKKILGITVLGVLCLSMVAFIGTNEPESYEDCVLKNMKGVESDKAAIIISNSCRSKFPTPIVYMTEAEAFGETTAVR